MASQFVVILFPPEHTESYHEDGMRHRDDSSLATSTRRQSPVQRRQTVSRALRTHASQVFGDSVDFKT